MTNEEMSKNINNRKFDQQKNGNYSPSSNYNLNQNQNNHSHYRNKKSNQHRKDHYLLERIIKQNDIIIRVLKDIRERLPAPPKKENQEEYINFEKNTSNPTMMNEENISKEETNATFLEENLTEEKSLSENKNEEIL